MACIIGEYGRHLQRNVERGSAVAHRIFSIALAQDGNEVIRLKNGQVLHLDVRDDIRENDEDIPKLDRRNDQVHDLGCLMKPHF